jgi:ferredoxin-type protein NapH
LRINWKWVPEKNKRVSYTRLIIQLISLLLIYYLAEVSVWKGLLLIAIMSATFFLGRFFCGWICPFGFYMDLVTWLRVVLKIPRWNLPDKLNAILHKLRYVIALVFVLLVSLPFLTGAASLNNIGDFVWLGGPFIPFTLMLAPLETLIVPWVPPFGALLEFGGKSLSFPYVGEIMAFLPEKDFALFVSVAFVVLVLAGTFKFRRVWCRFCPTGISISAINKFQRFKSIPFLYLNKEEEKCTGCGICKRVCPVQVNEVYEAKGGNIKTSMCTLCLRCVEMCPYEDCLKVCLGEKALFRSRNWLKA